MLLTTGTTTGQHARYARWNHQHHQVPQGYVHTPARVTVRRASSETDADLFATASGLRRQQLRDVRSRAEVRREEEMRELRRSFDVRQADASAAEAVAKQGEAQAIAALERERGKVKALETSLVGWWCICSACQNSVLTRLSFERHMVSKC